MRAWLALLGNQAVWLVAAWSAGRGLWWPGLLAAAAFTAAMLASSRGLRGDLRLLAAALACGVLLDGGLRLLGWLHYGAARPALLAPLWILGLWAAFAVILQPLLGWLLRRPALAALFGALGGPLAYLGAARGFDAVQFVQTGPALIWLAIGWGLAMFLFARLGAPAVASPHPHGVPS
ncbi:DUF2878 family protein [Thermomonas flagellata]|uniref:DUF2878 family protein n=1 Tax=Thermomonas flagellata TaxID=2888524 RepID=UPI001F03BBAF|nr:DUF2878 family protein [Thermomonas flagellata]